MPEPTAAEVVPKVIVREGLPVTPASPAEKMAGQVIKRADEGDWRKGAEELLRQRPIEKNKITQTLEQIGFERDPTTGAKTRSADEQLRFDAAKNNSDFAIKFIESRYEGMLPAEQDALRSQVLATARLNPAFAAELNGLTDPQKNTWAERKLKDPNFAVVARKLLLERSDPDRIKIIDTITPAQESLEKAKIDSEDATAARKDHDRSLNINDRRLAEYEERDSGRKLGGRPVLIKGAKLQELEGIASNMQIAQGSLDSSRTIFLAAQDDVKRLQDELGILTRQASSGLAVPGARDPRVVQQELIQVRAREAGAQEQLTRDTAKVDGLRATQERLETEHEELIERQKQLDTEKRALDRQVREGEIALQKRQQELADAQGLRVGQEQGIVDGFGNVFKDATSELLNQQVNDALSAYNAELDVLKQQTTDNNEKAMYAALQEEMLGPELTRKKGLLGFRTEEKYRPISKTMVNAHHDVLMTKGPEVEMHDLLATRINPATGLNYTDPEIADILANKEYVTKMQPEVVRQIIGRKMLTGGLSQEDIHVIVYSQWGQGRIKEATEKNNELREAIEKDMGPGALSSPNFSEKLAERIRKHPWWLLLILGIPVLVGSAALKKSLEDIGR